MKAIVQDGYGSPDVLTLREIETPAIGDDGILVKVHAASVNALDWHFTRGRPFLVRMAAGFRSPRDRVRGVDFAGRVMAVGKNVTRVQPGDDVFGGADGSLAESAATIEDRVALKPAGLTWAQTAVLNVAGCTALQGLRDKARLQRGQKVLIIGAGGGVGMFAVQISKWLGAHVTAVTRTESVELVRSLGADEVIDHRTQDFARGSERYDVLFDIGGTRSLADCRRVMAADAIFVVVGGPQGRWIAPADRMFKAMAYSRFVKQRFVPFLSKHDPAGLALLGKLVEEGTITPVIDRRYTLNEAADAIRSVGEGHARGKVVVEIA